MLQTSEKEILRKEHHGSEAAVAAADAEDEVLYKIDIPANRYDMLCLEGIARALNIFNGRQRDVQYRVADMSSQQPLRMTVRMAACPGHALSIVSTACLVGSVQRLHDVLRCFPPVLPAGGLQVKPETALVRPFVVAAVLRGVSFDATRYKSFIDLQVLTCTILCGWHI